MAIGRAAALDPLSYIAHGNLALRCLNSDLLEEADAALDQAFKLNPRAGLLPPCLVRCGWNRAVRRGPRAFQQEGIEALRLSGICNGQHGLGTLAESEATLKQLIERCADDGALQIAEAFAYLRRRRSRLRVAGTRLSTARPGCRCNRGRCCATCTAIRAGALSREDGTCRASRAVCVRVRRTAHER